MRLKGATPRIQSYCTGAGDAPFTRETAGILGPGGPLGDFELCLVRQAKDFLGWNGKIKAKRGEGGRGGEGWGGVERSEAGQHGSAAVMRQHGRRPCSLPFLPCSSPFLSRPSFSRSFVLLFLCLVLLLFYLRPTLFLSLSLSSLFLYRSFVSLSFSLSSCSFSLFVMLLSLLSRPYFSLVPSSLSFSLSSLSLSSPHSRSFLSLFFSRPFLLYVCACM